MTESQKRCFAIMPISDPPGYEEGHFNRVYSHLIKPACAQVGIEVIRADDVKRTNYIILDIIQKILQSDLVICDLSGKNPNVLYELGIRQAFNLPVVLIKDKQTDRIFDIQGFRTLDYTETLRIDKIQHDIKDLVSAIEETMLPKPEDINSFTKLLSIKSATFNEITPLSQETSLILNSLQDISARLTKFENLSRPLKNQNSSSVMKVVASLPTRLPNGETVSLGEKVYASAGGDELGTWFHNNKDGVVILDKSNQQILIPIDSDIFDTITTMPF